ncbi:uncharacterized protein E0L32_011748 [Thyridium curvatum]|uniref:Heterokaryon incompatibility domain-containing protein n=1 Tax=Thyridium curvatum TaxID=1093900 RepID=A0A507BEF0_9PEZI|nr:uncharacterized protein E0L32_011748 [Thyridium curvatum]TPX18337.1 hypothetical protein E0L32_011748 [Thyridium curvatum]
MAFTYRPLNTARHEIRLLHLLPAKDFNEPLRCELDLTTLQDAPPYEALSYTWGQPLITQPIELDSQPFNITVNLESALRHLRKPSDKRRLWVDAICINQDDTAERSHQVTLMKAIYSHCLADLAWLGPNPSEMMEAEHDDYQRAQLETRLKDLHAGMDLMVKIKDRDINTLAGMKENMERQGRPDGGWMLDYEQEQALVTLFRLTPLWQRIWVTQELSCAPHVVLVAGDRTLDWSVLFDFLGDTPYADAFHVVGGHGPVNRMASRQIFRHAEHIQHQRSIMRDTATKGSVSKLIDVLARFRHARSSDPRDKVYGLLGLVTEEHGVTVSYAKTAHEVYVDVTKSIIDSAGNLDIICQNPWQGHYEYRQPKMPGLPTWVPDFSCTLTLYEYQEGPERLENILFAQRGIFAASTKPCQVPCRVRDGKRLLVRGIILDEVGPVLQKTYHMLPEDKEKEESADPEAHHVSKRPERWMKLYYGTTPLDDRSQVYAPTGEPLFQAYCRSLSLDCKAYPIVRLSAEDVQADAETFAGIVRKSMAGQNLVKRTGGGREWISEDLEGCFGLQCWSMASRAWRHFCFSLSKTGLMIMLPRGAKDGDVLAIVEGGKVPFLLRPSMGGDGVVEYEYLDAVYVHGFMDGEAERLVGEGKLEMQELSII